MAFKPSTLRAAARVLGLRSCGLGVQAPLACTVPQQQRFVTDAPRRFDVNAGVWDNPFLAPIAKRIQGPVARSDDEREGVAGADAAMTTVPPAPLLAGSGLMASMNTPTIKFWMESCVGAGTVKMGLPGLAAQVLFFAPMQAMAEIRSKADTGRMPLLPYSAMCTNGFIWCTYGALLDNPAIWLPNVPAFILGAAYTAVFVQNCPKEANWLPSTTGVHIAGIGAHLVAIPALVAMLDTQQAATVIGGYGVGVCIVMFSGPLSSIKDVIKDKSTASIPFAFTVATIVNCTLWTFYGTVINLDSYIWLPNTLGLASGLAQMALFAKYGFGKPKAADKQE